MADLRDLVPFLGVFAYLIANSDDMARRNIERAGSPAGRDGRARPFGRGAGGAAAEIERAKGLLDTGAITQTEFYPIKAKALA